MSAAEMASYLGRLHASPSGRARAPVVRTGWEQAGRARPSLRWTHFARGSNDANCNRTGQTPSEELTLVATRLPRGVFEQLRTMADVEGRATSSLARLIIENFFYAGLPPQMRAALEEDEKRLGLNRRDYLNHLLFDRIQALQANPPAKGKR